MKQDRHRCRSCFFWETPGGKLKMVRSLPSGGPLPAEISRSGQEVSLDAEEHRHDVLVFDRVGARRTRAARGEVRRAAERRVQLGVENFQADIEVRMRVPLRPRTDLEPA